MNDYASVIKFIITNDIKKFNKQNVHILLSTFLCLAPFVLIVILLH